MKKKGLEIFASECQMAADELSYEMGIALKLSKFQSKCDFNLFWLYSIYPEIILRIETIEFLNIIIDKFKRKLKVNEILLYDAIIKTYKPQNFDQFKKSLKAFGNNQLI